LDSMLAPFSSMLTLSLLRQFTFSRFILLRNINCGVVWIGMFLWHPFDNYSAKRTSSLYLRLFHSLFFSRPRKPRTSVSHRVEWNCKVASARISRNQRIVCNLRTCTHSCRSLYILSHCRMCKLFFDLVEGSGRKFYQATDHSHDRSHIQFFHPGTHTQKVSNPQTCTISNCLILQGSTPEQANTTTILSWGRRYREA
jgi:hypothetical protein